MYIYSHVFTVNLWWGVGLCCRSKTCTSWRWEKTELEFKAQLYSYGGYGFEQDIAPKLMQMVESQSLRLMALRGWTHNPVVVSRRWAWWEVLRSLGACPWKVVLPRGLLIKAWVRLSCSLRFLARRVIIPAQVLHRCCSLSSPQGCVSGACHLGLWASKTVSHQ